MSGKTRKRVIHGYLNIPKKLRNIPDKIIKHRGSAQGYLDRHAAKGKNSLNNMVNNLSKPRRKKRR